MIDGALPGRRFEPKIEKRQDVGKRHGAQLELETSRVEERSREIGPRREEQLLGRADLFDPPRLEEADAAAEHDGLGDVVRHEHHGLLEIGSRASETRSASPRRVIASSAPNGSSRSTSGGSETSARARPTRCCSPPLNSRGRSSP